MEIVKDQKLNCCLKMMMSCINAINFLVLKRFMSGSYKILLNG